MRTMVKAMGILLVTSGASSFATWFGISVYEGWTGVSVAADSFKLASTLAFGGVFMTLAGVAALVAANDDGMWR